MVAQCRRSVRRVTRHRYPARALAGDYARAGLGIALTAPPLLLLELNTAVFILFAVLIALFAVFAWRTLLRQLGAIQMDEVTIRRSGLFPLRMAWDALDELRLGYYATRRDGTGGWMQLALRAGRRRLQLDSRIDGFTAIAAHAAIAARRRHLPLSPVTASNLAALGIAVPAQG
jgi:hypothetical protein